MLNSFFSWALGITQGLGHIGVGVLMAVESSLIPFPSEIVVPPAAYLASLGEMNIYLVIFFGVAGSVVGASFNYWLAVYLGRPLVYKLAEKKWAHWLLISPDKISQAEQMFLKNADAATLFGRLIPVVRQLVSLPAGFCGMPFWRFVFLTALGSGIWVIILALLGYFVGANRAALALYYHEITYGLLLLGVAWLTVKIYQTKKKA